MDKHLVRRQHLGKLLAESGHQAFFASSPVTMDYYSGFGEDGSERFMVMAINQAGEIELFCPALSVNQAVRCGLTQAKGYADGVSPDADFRAFAASWNLKSVAIDDEMRGGQLLRLQGLMPGVTLVAGSKIAGQVMRTKCGDELADLHEAGRQADYAYTKVLDVLKPGLTEEQVARDLSDFMAEAGGRPTFGIIAAGPNGAEPHHHADKTVLESGQVVIMDFGCNHNGYNSDITRTIALGEPETEADKVYETVYAAHMAARAKIRPGVTAGEVDKAARDVIDQAGYGEFFVHRTGHGLGMRVHEEPNIMPGSDEILQVGDCFSIEPGIYLPGRFGVRIENIVTVSDNGHVSFNDDPPAKLPRI